jgi:hypothetical protein
VQQKNPKHWGASQVQRLLCYGTVLHWMRLGEKTMNTECGTAQMQNRRIIIAPAGAVPKGPVLLLLGEHQESRLTFTLPEDIVHSAVTSAR